ncbi:pilus assembly protein [Paenibacillaceae bacterium]|nr:pilus assembly protein [Paenibacillaceae bacterium]
MQKRSKVTAAIREWVRKREEGSFTLESSLVFPLLFAGTLAMIFMAMYVYQQVTLYHIASTTAERTAFAWDNSYRDGTSGQASPGKYDGLYWRMKDDEMLESLFGIIADQSPTVLSIPSVANGEQGGLTTRKMLTFSPWIPSAYQGDMTFKRTALQRAVHVGLHNPIVILPIERFIYRSEPAGRAYAGVVDPVEFIRNVDLARYYLGKIGNKPEAADSRKKASSILSRRQGLN